MLSPLTGGVGGALHGYVSEIAAANQPYGGMYRTGDAVAGAAALLAAVLLSASARPRGARATSDEPETVTRVQVAPTRLAGERAAEAGEARARPSRPGPVAGFVTLLPLLVLGAVAVFGLATLADALVPLECTPSYDSGCAAREKAGTVSTAHKIHVVTSSLAGSAGTVACLAGAAAVLVGALPRIVAPARRGLPAVGPAGVVAVTAAVVHAAAMTWLLVDIAVGGGLIGVAQRIQLASVSIWMLAHARLCARVRPTAPHPVTP